MPKVLCNTPKRKSLRSLVILAAALLASDFHPSLAAADDAPDANVHNTTSSHTTSHTAQRIPALQPVIVTARKRVETLQNVPIALTVINANSLSQSGALSLQDYYATVPGLSVVDFGNGRVGVTMRGLSTGVGNITNPTVAITIDDVPIGASDTAIILGAQFVPQLDPADLQQIEFLKGPQGTLYGASSIGGVIRYVTATPNVNATSGHIETDGNVIADDGGSGFGLRGSVNVPVIENRVAVRGSLFYRRDPGYVDDPSHGQHNVNGANDYGGMLSLLFRLSDRLTARILTLYQRTEGKGDSTVDTDYQYHPLSGAATHTRMPFTGPYDHQLQLYSANVTYHLNHVDVTSITGYSHTRIAEDQDETLFFGSLAGQYVPGADADALVNLLVGDKLTEELRVSSTSGGRFEWQFGGFYTHENNSPSLQTFTANYLATGATLGSLLSLSYPSIYNEYAAFFHLTYSFTNSFNIQIGGREAYNQQHNINDYSGPFIGPVPTFLSFRSRGHSFTYLVTPQYKFSNAVTAYGRIATGYQAGGPNTPSMPTSSIPSTFEPSTTLNYELGLKTRLFQNRLSLDTDIFSIKWSRIQLSGLANGISYVFNGGKADSKGAELSINAIPITGLTLSATAAYTDAHLTTTVGNGFPGISGDPLPNSSKVTTSFSAEDRFPVSGFAKGFVGVTIGYVGKRYLNFPPAPAEPQPSVPAYTYGNAKVGLEISGYTVTVYLNNVTNARGVLSTTQITGETPQSGVWYTSFITPRTLGISIQKRF